MNKIMVIAEIGVNHNGYSQVAERMISIAKDQGVDAVKFQMFTAKEMVSAFAPKAAYQHDKCPDSASQLEMLEKLELKRDDFANFKKICNQKGVLFMVSPFDLENADFLNNIGTEHYKIASGELTNLPLLRKIGSFDKKVYLSTGMSVEEEIGAALDVLVSSGTKKGNIFLLHCNSAYPTPAEDVNLKAILFLQERFGLPVGYSDHTLGIVIPMAAAAAGAVIIEKHFTLDKNMEGPDHALSADTDELKEMIEGIRMIEIARGDAAKKVTGSESPIRDIARRSIVARREIQEGEILTIENITTKRPGTGLNPMLWDEVVGTAAKRTFDRDELIEI